MKILSANLDLTVYVMCTVASVASVASLLSASNIFSEEDRLQKYFHHLYSLFNRDLDQHSG